MKASRCPAVESLAKTEEVLRTPWGENWRELLMRKVDVWALSYGGLLVSRRGFETPFDERREASEAK